jgi:hypothetical protein
MKYLKPIIVLVLVFIAGISVGVVATRTIIKRDIRRAIVQPEMVRLRIERELTRELSLNAAQQIKLDEILLTMQQEIATARKERQPHLRPILANAQKRLSEILTPEQQEKFEKYQAEYGVFSFGGQGQGQNFPRLQKLKKLREGNQSIPTPAPQTPAQTPPATQPQPPPPSSE